jgi:hypothetical protein
VDVVEAERALLGHAPGRGGHEGGVLLRVQIEDRPLVAHLGQYLPWKFILELLGTMFHERRFFSWLNLEVFFNTNRDHDAALVEGRLCSNKVVTVWVVQLVEEAELIRYLFSKNAT